MALLHVVAFLLQVFGPTEDYEQWERLSNSQKLNVAAGVVFEIDESLEKEQTPLSLIRLNPPESTENGSVDRYALITLKEVMAGSYEPQAYLSIFYLDWVDGRLGSDPEKWFVDYEELYVFDKEDFLDVRRNLLTAPAVLVTSESTRQGCTVGSTRIVALVSQGPRTVANVPTKYSQLAFEPYEETIGLIQSVEPGRSFRVSYSGKINQSTRWVRSGGTYNVVSNVDIGTC